MKILALELSSGMGSIARREGAIETFAATFANDRKHSGLFFETLQRALWEGPPEKIVVGLGPGSYAGARIAIATATGLAAASGAQLLGVASVRAIDSAEKEYVVIGDARRSSFFFAQVRERECMEGPVLCSEEELRVRLGAWRGPVYTTEAIGAFPEAEVRHASAGILAEIAAGPGGSGE